MSKIEKFSRISVKTITLPDKTPTIPLSNDHTLSSPQWKVTDIYVGEFLLNTTSGRLYIRANNSNNENVAIEEIAYVRDLEDFIRFSGNTLGLEGTSGTSGVDGDVNFNIEPTFFYDESTDTLHSQNIQTSGITYLADGYGENKFVMSDENGNLIYRELTGSTLTDLTGTTDYQILMFSGGTWVVSDKMIIPGDTRFDPYTGQLTFETLESGTYYVPIFGGESGLTNLQDGDTIIFKNGQWTNTGITLGSESGGVVNGIDSFAPNSGLKFLDNSTSGMTIYNTSLTSLVVPQNIGGITSGTTVESLTGKTLVQILDDILFPTVFPKYKLATLTVALSTVGSFEVGVTINNRVTVAATKNDAGNFTTLEIYRRTNIINSEKITISDPSITISQTTDTNDNFIYPNLNDPNYIYSYSINDNGIKIPSTLNTESSYIDYEARYHYNSGFTKNTNKGDIDNRVYKVRQVDFPQAAYTLSTISSRIIGWYPYFYGKTENIITYSDVVNIIQSGSGYTKVVNNSAGTLDMAFNAEGEYCWFAIFSAFPNKTDWKEQENLMNDGDIGKGVNDLFSAPTTLSINSPDLYWSNINYNIYIGQKATTIGTCKIT